MTDPEPTVKTSRIRRSGIILALAIVAYLALGLFVVPAVVESQLLRLLEERTGVAPHVEGVSFDPIRLRLTIEGFSLRDPAGSRPALAFDELAIGIRPLGFFRADVALGDVALIGPHVSLAIDESGELNFVRLFTAPGEAASSSDADEPGEADDEDEDGLIVEVGSIRIERGAASFSDANRIPPFDVEVGPFDLELEGFTTRAGGTSPYSLTLHVGEATKLQWSGTLGLNPFRSEGRIDLAGFELRLPWTYLDEQLKFEVASGRATLAASYAVERGEKLDASVTKAGLVLEDVVLKDRANGEVAVRFPRLAVGGVEAKIRKDVFESLDIAEVAIESGGIDTRRESDGGLRLVELFTPIPGPAADSEGDSADEGADGTIATAAGSQSPEPTDAETTTEPQLHVARIRVTDFDLGWEDHVPAQPAMLRLEGIDLRIDELRNARGSAMTLALSATARGGGEGRDDGAVREHTASAPEEEAAGQIRIEGPLGLDPLTATLTIEADRIGLAAFQPYLQDIARLDVSNGSLSSRLVVSLADGGARDEAPSVAVKGRLQIDDLETRGRGSRHPFLAWKALRLEGLDFAQDRLRLEEVGLEGASARVRLAQDGSSNLSTIFPARAEAPVALSDAKAPSKREAPLGLEIDRIRLDDLALQFSDLSVTPAFEISVGSLAGSITGLSSTSGQPATVDLEGRIDENASLAIKGQVSPLSENGFGELSIDVAGISTAKFTPYSGRFVGRAVERGSLDLDLEYRLKERILDATNNVVLRRFAFGDTIASEEATSLPVLVAAELMRGPQGDIALELPVHGDLDDPSFSVLGVLGKTLVNLITRVVSSPFAVMGEVGSWVGIAGDDPGTVLFEPGSDALSPDEQESLAALAKLLSTRPTLRLEIRGRADPVVDADGAAHGLTSAEAQEVARRRAQSVQRALLAATDLDPGRIALLGVEVGDVARDGQIPVLLNLSAD